MRHYVIPFFIPEFGCPHRCIYCNQHAITGSTPVSPLPEVDLKISQYLESMPKSPKSVEVAFFGGNFTGLALQEQKEYLQKAEKWIDKGAINGIRISTRPDYITPAVLQGLKKHGVKTIELGVQSMDDEVLRLSGRGHNARHVEDASKLILEYGFRLCLQMMTGLPGDSMEKTMFTAQRIVDLGAVETRIYPVLVIRDTPLANMFEQGKYVPLSMPETIERCKNLVLFFEANLVKVLRLGLHPSEGICAGHDLIAGPFHPALRELVNTAIWKEILEKHLKYDGALKLTVEAAPNQLQSVIGHKQSNKKYFLQYFNQVEIKINKELHGREFRINYC